MKKNVNLILLLVSFFLILGVGLFYCLKYKKIKTMEIKENNYNVRYEEIKNAVNLEMERYIYLRWPTCDPQYTSYQKISDGELVSNGGMDREKFLDVDDENYCDTISYATCTEKNKWEFKTYIRCKGYEDSEFIDWDK